MANAPDGNPLEQVQSILFGQQMQDITRRFEALDQRLSEKTNEVLSEVRDRVAALEQAGQERERTLREALDAQQRDGESHLAKLRSLLEDEQTSWREQVDRLKNQLSKLQDAKPDRADLSAMLMDVARRLGGDRDGGNHTDG